MNLTESGSKGGRRTRRTLGIVFGLSLRTGAIASPESRKPDQETGAVGATFFF
jgi:hypothetical protein